MGNIRDAILATEDLPQRDVETPEWAPTVPKVTVRGLTAAEREDWEKSNRNPRDPTKPRPGLRDIRARFVALILIDPESGSRVFDDDDVKALNAKSAAVIDRLFDVGRELSGMLTDDEKEKLAEGNPSEGEPEEEFFSVTSPSPSESSIPDGSAIASAPSS